MKYYLHKNDIPNDLHLGQIVSLDTETMGLNILRDRLCLVQLCSGNGEAHLVQIENDQNCSPNLIKLLTDQKVLKLFHFGRFDIAVLLNRFKVLTKPVYCTKIASKIARTSTDRHGLKNLVSDLLSIEIPKEEQSSDWGKLELTSAQLEYAGRDVIYLHEIKLRLDQILIREKRNQLAKSCFDFLPNLAYMDLQGFNSEKVFSH